MTNERHDRYSPRNDRRGPRDNNDNRFRRSTRVTNLVKAFSSFDEGYSEMLKLVPEVKSYGGETPLYDSVIGNILKVINDNIPSTQNSNYPKTFSFNINAHQVGLLTDSGLAIGWRTYFDAEAGTTVFRFRISFLNINTHQKNIVETMKEAGWIANQKTFDNTNKRASSYNKSKNYNPQQQSQNQDPINIPDEGSTSVVDFAEDTTKDYNPDIVEQFQKAGFNQSESEPQQVAAEDPVPQPVSFDIDTNVQVSNEEPQMIIPDQPQQPIIEPAE